MATNIDRFKKDLDRLVTSGDRLEAAMQRAISRDEFDKRVQGRLGKEKADAYLKTVPEFGAAYEEWYSESLALISQLLPDRVRDFVSLYEKPKSRKELSPENYVIRDFLQGLEATRAGRAWVDRSAAISQLAQQVAIVKATRVRFESSLFEIRQLVQADLFDTELAAARELLKSRFQRAAGAVAGVVLEKHLLQVCEDHKIQVAKKNPTIGDLNELLKANSVIDVPQWRQLSFLGDVRNLCVHNKKVEPTEAQVNDLIDGADKILKTVA